MTKHKNIFTGDTVEVIAETTTEGRTIVAYEKLTNKQKNELGMVIEFHTKPDYVFTATYKEVTL